MKITIPISVGELLDKISILQIKSQYTDNVYVSKELESLIEIAKELINIAKACGCTCAKFQKRNPKELLSEEQYNAPHPVPKNSYGDTYGAHREFLELSLQEHKELKKHSEFVGITYSTSVWDVTSAVK